MGWFTPKLEPGERVVLRNTALRDPMLFVTTSAAGAGLLLLFFGRHPDVPDMGALRVLLFVVGSLVLYWAAVIFISHTAMAGWIITDRRVLSWRGLLNKQVEQLRRDEIDRSNLNGDDLMVRGGGRSLRLNLKRVRDNAVQAALGAAAPPAGLKAEALNRILGRGETIVWRHPPLWMRALPAAAALSVVALLLFWVTVWLGWGGEQARRINLFGVPGLAVILLAVLPQLSGAAAWSATVTDRRILLRRLHDFTRYDDIPLAAIEKIETPHEGSHRVYLHANGQRYEFRPGNQAAAERMHAAIRRVAP